MQPKQNNPESDYTSLKNRAEKSSRYAFIAEHRGGPLKKAQHRQLIHWAQMCIQRVLPLFGDVIDERLEHALKVAKAWEKGTASVGDARNAALGAFKVAKESINPTSKAIARGVGHAVASAHMADHALAAAEYALKALAHNNKPIEEERKWQDEQLPSEIRELVLTSRKAKSKFWQSHVYHKKKNTTSNKQI